MSKFNPEQFMQSSVTGAMSTEIIPIPEGEYNGIIQKVDARLVGKDKDRAVMDVFYLVDDEEVRKTTGMEKPSIRQTVWLDINENGGLDVAEGKNVGLGRLREAVGQNDPTREWAPSMLQDQVVKILVKHSMGEGENAGKIYANVTQVAGL